MAKIDIDGRVITYYEIAREPMCTMTITMPGYTLTAHAGPSGDLHVEKHQDGITMSTYVPKNVTAVCTSKGIKMNFADTRPTPPGISHGVGVVSVHKQ